MDAAARRDFEAKTGANFSVMPSQGKGLPLVDPAQLGKVVFAGPIWTLIQLG
jgi:hypothetical protein